MKSLRDLLSSHPVPGVKEAHIRSTCAEVISKTLGIPVTPKVIHLKDGVLTLKMPPVVKSAATLKFAQIKEALVKESITVLEIR